MVPSVSILMGFDCISLFVRVTYMKNKVLLAGQPILAVVFILHGVKVQ